MTVPDPVDPAPSPAPPAILAPVAAAERMPALDVVRGFALLGIFLMNVEFFARPLQDIGGASIDPAMHGLDRAADAAIFFLVQGKFWTLFSLLFGMGFAVMIDRSVARGRNVVPVYLRRSLALLAIGTGHALLVWSGDILVTYAIAALVLLGLRTLRHAFAQATTHEAPEPLRPRVLGALGATAFTLSLLMALAMGASGSLDPPTAADREQHAATEVAQARDRTLAVAAYAHGSYGDAVAQRVRDTEWQLAPQSLVFFLPTVVGIFMLGMAVLRTGVMARPAAQLPALRRVRDVGLASGLALMAASAAIGTDMDFDRFDLRAAAQVITYLVAGLVLAVAYGAMLLAALPGRAGPWLERWLAPAGRMALTNYLLQSVAGTLTFYGYGLGVWDRLGRAGGVAFVFVVYALQLVASRWWLARFRFGPAEWLWRAATYLAWPPMRRAPA